jgi:hypothetical protein
MGRMKDIAIGMMEDHEQIQGDLFIDEELRTLMQNFKPTAEELQAELDELQAHALSLPSVTVKPEYKVFLLMKNGFPQRSYTDRSLAFYECWVCTMGDEALGAEEPDDWYVVEIMHDESIYTGE